MKPSPRVILLALLLCAPAAASARVSNKPERPRGLASPSSEPRVQLGVFEGAGHACGGLLKITPRRMSWKTPFSPCPASACTLAERRRKGGATLWTYRFPQEPPLQGGGAGKDPAPGRLGVERLWLHLNESLQG